jgi:hypothetical protein
MMFRYFKGSFAFTAVCLVIGAWVGWTTTQDVVGTLGILWIVLVLGVLEVSLSFDNAVVNATVLRDMTPIWQRRFLTWGIIIAVFGMRIVFPLVIVAIAARLGPTRSSSPRPIRSPMNGSSPAPTSASPVSAARSWRWSG